VVVIPVDCIPIVDQFDGLSFSRLAHRSRELLELPANGNLDGARGVACVLSLPSPIRE